MQNDAKQDKHMFVGKIVFHKDYVYGQVTSESGVFGECICIKFTGRERIPFSCSELLKEGVFTDSYEIAELQKRAIEQKQAEEEQTKEAERIKRIEEEEKKHQEELDEKARIEQAKEEERIS